MQVKLRVAAAAALIASTGILSAAVAPHAAAQARPRPPSSAALTSELYGVSCISASTCVAVGDYVTSNGASKTLVERWNGTAWAVQSSPNPSSASYLNGVSCTSASACIAVGHYVSGSSVTLAERWDGTS